MKQLFVITIQMAALLWVSAQSAFAYWPADAAEVTYKVTNDEGVNYIKKTSDGQGRLRIETSGTAGKTVRIEYPAKNKMLDLDESSKSGAWQGLKPEQSEQGSFAKVMTGKKLKDSMIAGHKCEGFEEVSTTVMPGGPSSVDQVWFDAVTRCPVLIQRTMRVGDKTLGSITNTMTSYTKKLSSPSLFQAPAGYKITGNP